MAASTIEGVDMGLFMFHAHGTGSAHAAWSLCQAFHGLLVGFIVNQSESHLNPSPSHHSCPSLIMDHSL